MAEETDFDKIEILLVDDHPENLLALEAALSSPDYNLTKVGSGDEVLRHLLDHNPALILMDVQMPGLNGFETARLIKGCERTREIPIVFVTGINSDEHFIHEGYDQGAVDYIYKPFDPYVLKSKVAVLAELRRHHQRVSRLVGVQKATTLALAEASSVNEAVSGVLRSICGSLGWDLGCFWKVDKYGNALYCYSGWTDPLRSETSEFVLDSFKRRFSRGVGLPGTVWSSGETLWVTDFSDRIGFPRFAIGAHQHLRTAVGFPVRIQGRILGVLEIFSRKLQARDNDLIEIMGSIGQQVGLVLQRTEAIELVRASEARKSAILEGSLDSIISMDHEGKITEFNPAAEATFGFKREEVIGKEVADSIIPPGLREAHRRGLRYYFETGEGAMLNRRVEMTGMRSDLSLFPVELTITRVPFVEPALFTAFLRDITDRKRNESNASLLAEASIALSLSLDYEETLHSLAKLAVKSFGDLCAIDVLDEGGEARTVALAHRDSERLESARALSEKYPRDWTAIARASDVIRTGKSEFYPEIGNAQLASGAKDEVHLKAISDFKLSSAIIVPLTARGNTLGAMTLITTGSSRRYTKYDLVVAEELARRAAIAIDNARLYRDAQSAIQARDDFFSIASHELKTPITSLKMMLQITRRGMDLESGRAQPREKLTKMIDTSNKEVDRLTHLVEDLLDVTKIRAGRLSIHLAELDLSESVREVVARFSDVLANAKCEVELSLEPKVMGMWDGGRIEQVIVNLLSNAIKYAPGKPIRIKVSGSGETAKLAIQDFGPGIPPEKQSKIFERFERAVSSRNISGLGLGLFIVKQIVEAHHGIIRVDSQNGMGSTFTIELPQGIAALHRKIAP